MPQIKARIEENFSVTPKIFDPDEAVAKGAAIYGWKLSLNDGLIERLSQRTNKPIAQIDEISEMIETKALSANDFKAAAQEVADKTGYTLPSVERSMLKVKNVTSKSFGIVAHTPQNEEIVFNIVLRNTGVPITLKKNFTQPWSIRKPF
ncbi:MAG: hypothetical protein R2861_05930 [Desulfobacterales bacterium]